MLRYIIDLDKTLAFYKSGMFEKDKTDIGDPIPGAREFVQKLSEHIGNDGKPAMITIFTYRMREDLSTIDRWNVRLSIASWLNRHDFPWDEIYDGRGKPDGTAFIDDKGVQCRPLENANAYAEAEDYIKNVILMEKR